MRPTGSCEAAPYEPDRAAFLRRNPAPTFDTAGFGTWRFDDDAVEFAVEYLRNAWGYCQNSCGGATSERERLGRHPGGAPERFPTEALWVAMILAALHNKAMLAITFRDILFKHISPAMRARLGVPEPPGADDRLGWEALYRCVRTRFHSPA